MGKTNGKKKNGKHKAQRASHQAHGKITKNKKRERHTDVKPTQQTIQNKDACIPSMSKKKLKKLALANTPSLRERMMQKLQGARFRYLNEQMYTSEGKDAKVLFKKDPQSFKAYHEGYQHQVDQWKVNPVDNIISNLKKKSSSLVIADFGCGDAKLATSLPNKVHSFDLVALNDNVTVCDMSHTPLVDDTVDVAVFCLSLMGTNLSEYLKEANRVLKTGGQLKIAEVESRFEDVNVFIKDLRKYGFKITSKNISESYFYFLDFKKDSNVKKKLPVINLKPCIYKRR